MDPELRKHLFIRKHLIGIFTILALTLMLPVTLLFTQTSPQTKQFAAQTTSAPIASQSAPESTPGLPSATIATTNNQQPSPTTGNKSPATKLNLTLCLHGIGNCGDNVATQSAGNMNPLHPSRPLTLNIYNKDYKLIKDIQTTAVYSPTLTKFTGEIEAEDLPSAAYNIKISLPGYLPAFIPSVQNIIAAKSNSLPSLSLVTGDVDRNNILNMQDYTLLMKCFEKPGSSNPCTPEEILAADLNDDGTINGVDYNLLMRESANQKILR